MTDDEQLQAAIELVRAMMSSASAKHIRPIEWWSRAKSALETAATCADSFGSLVSTMGRKLQIEVTRVWTGQEIVRLAHVVGSDFETWRRYVVAEALYVVAIAQAESKERRAAREAEMARVEASWQELKRYTETNFPTETTTKEK